MDTPNTPENTPESAPIVMVPFRTKSKTPGDIEAEQGKQPQAPEQPAAAPLPKQLDIVPFPDGAMFKFQPNKSKAGTFIINDGAGTPVALVLLPEIAELICKSVTIVFHQEAERAKQKQAAAAELSNATDALTAPAPAAIPTPTPDGEQS